MPVIRNIAVMSIAMLLACAVVAACGGDDDDDDGDDSNGAPPTATAPATSGAGDGTPTPAASQPTAPGDPPSAEEDADAREAFDEVVQRFAAATFKADYRVALAPEDGLQNASMTMQKDGPDRLRTDIRADQDGQVVELIVIDTPEASGFCFKDAGEFGELFDVPPGEGICFENDPTGGGFGGLSEALAELQEGNVAVLDRTERTIAGIEAACFTVRDEEQTDEACFADDGTLLAVNNEGGTQLEATSVSSTVDGDAFVLPYEAREFPDLGAGQ